MILDIYLGRQILLNSLVALLALLSIFLFFTLVEELNNTGINHYGINAAIVYVLLSIPKFCYELMPASVLIGSITTLGIATNNNELVIIKTVLSAKKLSFILIKITSVIVVLSLLIGEIIAPKSEQIAQQQKSIARYGTIAAQTKNSLWWRDNNHYINVNKVLAGNHFEDIYIHQFSDRFKLKSSLHARHAHYTDQQWLLFEVEKTDFHDTHSSVSQQNSMNWRGNLTPELIEATIVKPYYLSMYDLNRYINYLKQNQQNANVYEQALLNKITQPFIIIAMALLALCIIKIGRNIKLNQHIFIGILIGIGLHFISQLSTYIGIIYNLPAIVSVSSPIILIYMYIYYVLSKQS